MPKATNPGFQYHENTSKNIAASLKGLHIISLPSQIKKCKITMKIIILVKPEYIIFIICGIQTNIFSNNLKNRWGLKHLASNKPSTSFPRKLLNCAPQEYSLYSTQIPNLLHVQVILKAQFVMPVQCSHVRRREDISICHFHGRNSHWISIQLFTSPK